MKRILSIAAAFSAAAACAAHISETMTLAKGWNAIYLESTPTNAACAEFFAGAPVERVASYQSDAYSSTRQYASDGSEITQKPVSYYVWVPGDADASTMSSLVGGHTYMIYASDVWTNSFYGVPAAPRQTWRATAGDSALMNLAGVSVAPGVSVTAKEYFGEGPFGTTAGITYKIDGSKPAAPTFLPMTLSAKTKLHGGAAYALTAAKDADWPGVVGVQSRGLFFGANANFASITIKNCGTTNHEFKLAVVRSDDYLESGEEMPPIARRLPRTDAAVAPGFTNVAESSEWTVELKAGESFEQLFSIDRSALEQGKNYGAILTIEDLGASKMRVRLPVLAAGVSEDAVKYPTGLWIGEIALSYVSSISDTTPMPVAPGAELKMNVMMHVDEAGKCTLLQRVAAGIDTNGTKRLFRELESVPAGEIENAKRYSTVMMSVDTPAVAAENGAKFGDDAVFTWAVAPTARDNPFRHAWHPDHDGKKADYSGYLPAGDDFLLYSNPVKPELWSITNRLDFSWHEGGNKAAPVDFQYNAAEATTGIVTWDVTGLSAKNPIRSVGTFTLKRIFKAKRLED